MARARNIKPGFFQNELLAELPPMARLLFIGLWCLADRSGRLEDRPVQIKMKLFAADSDSPNEIDGHLFALHQRGFIVRYAAGSSRYIQVLNWEKHQNPHHREKESTIPSVESLGPGVVFMDVKPQAFALKDGQKAEAFECGAASTALYIEQKASGFSPVEATSAVLIPDSLIPDSLIQTPLVQKAPKVKPPGKDKPVPDRFDEFWKAYPRKEAKVNALKAFAKVAAHDIPALLAGLAQWNAYWTARAEPEFTPLPASWLNARRWEDDIPTIRQKRSQAPEPSRQARQLQAIEDVINDPAYNATAQRHLASDRHRPRPATPDHSELSMDTGPGRPSWDDDGVD